MILIGPAGNISENIISSLYSLKEYGLKCMEIEFVRQIWMNNKTAKEVGELAKKLNIKLSVHASYFINLNSEDKEKLKGSERRILEACERGYYMGAENIVFHPGYYGKKSKEESYNIIKNEIIKLHGIIKEKKWDVKLCPETTGKVNVFGSLDEIIRLVKETKCSLCVDFAHLYARNYGKINYKDIFDKLKVLKLNKLHGHYSGIEYGTKGEKRHIKVDMNQFKKLLKDIPKKLDVVIINESPYILEDALKMWKLVDN
ncbi:MAG: TIM barrel protein [Nanoarchaeota archaeon]|nr:TIM barrel protein [Nanoarchaeota archaeon]